MSTSGRRDEMQALRRASPNEQRTISREDLGFYHAVIIAAVYDLGRDVDAQAPETFFLPLRRCIEKHPFLGVVVADKHTEKAYYQRVESIDLHRHVEISKVAHGKAKLDAIEDLFEANLDQPFPPGIPPWKIIVLPLQTGECLVAFSFSHTIGDGISGPCFHGTFLEATQQMPRGRTSQQQPAVVQPPPTPLPAPFDTPERLPISWSYLLRPLIAVLVPKFLANLLGVQASAFDDVPEGTWTATRMFHDARCRRPSRARIIMIEAPVLDRALRLSRAHDAKLTGVMQQAISRALARELRDRGVTHLVSQTAVNMRSAVGVPHDEIGEFVSGCDVVHPVSSSCGDDDLIFSEDDWSAARDATRRLAEARTKLRDQPIGLLRYAPSIRGWMQGRIGDERDCSFEVSNVGSFDGGAGDGPSIKTILFAQPGHVVGPPICFNVASVKGDCLVCTVTWQTGALGVENEGAFVDRVCGSFKEEFARLE